MKTTNIDAVFAAVQRNEPLTKQEIMSRTGLSWSTVSVAVTQLLESGLLCETDSEEVSNTGRPPKVYDINGDDFFVVGCDIAVEGILAVVTDFKARRKYAEFASLSGNSRTHIFEKLFSLLDSVLSSPALKGKTVAGIGVAMMGVVDVENGVSRHCDLLSDWENVDLRSALSGRYGLPVLLEHDPNCMALREGFFTGSNYENMLYLRMGYGVGLSVIINNRIYRGSTGGAVEIGAVTYNHTIDGEIEPLTIEKIASAYGVVTRYRAENSDERFSRATDGDSIFAMLKILGNDARSGDEAALRYFREAGVCLGMSAVNLMRLFNPEILFLGGEFMEYRDLFMDDFYDHVDGRIFPSQPEIRVADSDPETAATGAAVLFLESGCQSQYYKG